MLWNQYVSSAPGKCSYSPSTAAGREYQALSGCNSGVPLEPDCTNFNSDCFEFDYMQKNGLSVSPIVVGSLEDMQYAVSYDFVDDKATKLARWCTCKRRTLEETTSVGARRLSAKGRAEATAIGEKALEESESSQIDRQFRQGYVDISGRVVIVLLREEGTLYSVIVRK